MPIATGKPLQVVVDLNRCQPYTQCCFLAAEVFELHGQEALWYDPETLRAEGFTGSLTNHRR